MHAFGEGDAFLGTHAQVHRTAPVKGGGEPGQGCFGGEDLQGSRTIGVTDEKVVEPRQGVVPPGVPPCCNHHRVAHRAIGHGAGGTGG